MIERTDIDTNDVIVNLQTAECLFLEKVDDVDPMMVCGRKADGSRVWFHMDDLSITWTLVK